MRFLNRFRGGEPEPVPEVKRVEGELSELLNQKQAAEKDLQVIRKHYSKDIVPNDKYSLDKINEKKRQIEELEEKIIQLFVKFLPLLCRQKAELQQAGKKTTTVDREIELVKARINGAVRILDEKIQRLQESIKAETGGHDYFTQGISGEISKWGKEQNELMRQLEALEKVLDDNK